MKYIKEAQRRQEEKQKNGRKIKKEAVKNVKQSKLDGIHGGYRY